MKPILVFLSFYLFCNFSFGQNFPKFRAWNGTDYNSAIDFPALGVASDFGPRNYGDNWHGGVDYNSAMNDGDNDFGDLILATFAGTVVDHGKLIRNDGKTAYLTLDAGDFRIVYMHMFYDDYENYEKAMNNSTVILKFMDNDDDDKWAMIFYVDGEVFTLGQANGTVTADDGTQYNVSNSVNPGDIIGPLGNSGGYGAHLHLNVIPDNETYWSQDDTYNRSPLQFFDYPIPTYSYFLRSKNFGQKVVFNYPGEMNSPIALEPYILGANNGATRYNHIMDLNKVHFKIKSPYTNEFEIIKGDNIQGIISLGGRIGESIINHPKGSFGSWNTSGVDAFAYSSQPFDRWHFSDLKTRLHKQDTMEPNVSLISNCPDNSMYNDGEYQLKCTTYTIREVENDTPSQIVILDNFKPYIKSVSIKTIQNNVEIYNESWTCTDNQCVTYSNSNLATNITAFEYKSGLLINVTASEQMKDIYLDIPAFNITNLVPELVTNNQVYTFRISAQQIHGIVNDVILKFHGSDKNSNQLISFTQEQKDLCVAIPYRKSNTEWVDVMNPKLVYGNDQLHKFRVACQGAEGNDDNNEGAVVWVNGIGNLTINGAISQPTDQICDNGSIDISILGGTGQYTFIWYKKDESGQYFEFKRVINVSGSDDEADLNNLISGNYMVEVNDSYCNTASKEFLVLNCNCVQIVVVEHQNIPDCGNPNNPFSLLGGSIEIDVIGAANYSIIWSTGAVSTKISNLSVGYYSVVVTFENCTKTMGFHICCCETALEDPVSLGLKCILTENDDITVSLKKMTYVTNVESHDGAIDIKITGFYTYIFWQGPNGFMSNQEDISNLAPGAYTVTVSNGCKSVSEVFHLKLCEELTFILGSVVNPTCPGVNGGSILLTPAGSNIKFLWSNGSTSNSIENLGVGIYTVSVWNSDIPECEQIFSFLVTEKVSEMPFDVDHTIGHSCVHQSTGKVLLYIEGGFAPYSYIWSNRSEEKNLTGVPEGTYSVTITDDCGNQVMRSFNIGNWIETIISLESESACGEGNGFANMTIDSPWDIINITWSNGSHSQNITNLSEGLYTVTITDTHGCMAASDIFINTISYEAQKVQPCENQHDGKLILSIDNPDNEAVGIFLQDINYYATTQGPIVDYTLVDLDHDINYHATIYVGECIFNYDFILRAEPLTTELADVDKENEICIYNDVCKGEVIEGSHSYRTIFWDHDDGYTLPCQVPGKCGGEVVEYKEFPIKMVRGWEYMQMVQESGLLNASALLEPINLCDILWVCTGNLDVVYTMYGNEYTGEGGTLIQIGDNCVKIRCKWPPVGSLNWPYFEYTACLCDNMPSWIDCNNIEIEIPEDCNPITMDMYQIVEWHVELLTSEPNYDPSKPSNLANFVKENMNSPEARCATVTFCQSDFTLLYTDFFNIECEVVYEYGTWTWEFEIDPVTGQQTNYQVPVIINETIGGCSIDDETSEGYHINCYPYCKKNERPEDCKKNVVKKYIRKNYDKKFFNKIEGDPNQTYLSLSYSDWNQSFVHFVPLIYNGIYAPKGVFILDDQMKMVNYSPSDNYFPAKQVVENNITQMIFDGNTNQFVIADETDHQNIIFSTAGAYYNWLNYLSSNQAIDIINIYKKDQKYSISGNYSGTLYWNGQFIDITNEKSQFLFEISLDGELVNDHIFKNSMKTFIDKSNMMSFVSNSEFFTHNGTELFVNQANTIISSVIDSLGNFALLNPTISFVSSVQVLNTITSDAENQIIATFGNGGFVFRGTEYQLPSNNELNFVISLKNNPLPIVHPIIIEGNIDLNNLSMDFDQSYFYVSLNFSGKILIGNSIIQSNGSKDFVILKIDQQDGAISYVTYGSEFDDELDEIYASHDFLYLGGTTELIKNEVEIGNHIFVPVNFGEIEKKYAFISNVDKDDFTPILYSSSQLVAPNHENNLNLNNFEIFPNPFSQKFNLVMNLTNPVSLKYSIYDMFGRLILTETDLYHKGYNSKEIIFDEKIPNGLYFIGVSQNEKSIWVDKIIKQ